MASPFLENPVDAGARIVQGSLRRARVFRDRHNPLAFSEDYLDERYRISREGIKYLCRLLEPYINNSTKGSHALTVPQTVCLALRFFGTGSFMYSVGDAECMSKNTVCRAVWRTVDALNALLDAFVVFPGHLPPQRIKEGFYSIAGFPRVLGAIDCTHVPLRGHLGENEADYVNRKSFHSLNIQMTCDHQLMDTSLDAKWPGSVHDSRIFRESVLCHKFEQGIFSGLLLGDRGYACRPFFMTPYPDPQEDSETRFNLALNRTRVTIEQTFGILKGRFRCLEGLRVVPQRAGKIVAACAVLHNIATIRKEWLPHVPLQPADVVDPMVLDYTTGRAVREAITQQYFN